MHRDFTGAPVANTWYQDSLGNSLHGSDQDATAVDMHITYNSAFTWYLGTNGVVPAGQYDLVTVAAHEIAHGLNFSGTAGYSGGLGSWGRGTGYPNIYDRFMESSGGTKVPAYANNSAALGSLYTSGSLWFDGTNANAANGATRVRMYAPGTWSGGSSYSHLDEIFNGTSNDMMTFSVPSGYSQHNPGNVTKGLLKDLGWVLASTTPVTIPTPTAPSGTISDRTPTFKWTKISGATQYRFDVYAGSTLVYSKTVTSTSACPSSTCSNTPTTSLAYAAHKWRVRAYVSGAWKTFSAYKTFTVTNIPTPQTPTGSITDTTPTFKWTRIDGATQYYLVVYNGTSTVAYTKTVTNANCGASTTTCSNTPTNVLTTGAHNWKVRAYVGGAWKAYSALKSFSVATSTAFNDHFTSSSAGWTPLNGSWSVASSYYQTPGIASMWTSAKHSNTYSTFTYEVTLSRTDNATLSYGIYFNASPTPLASTGGWNNGYAFYILDDGYYSVWRRAGGVATNLWPWTSSAGISSGTNTLKVTYNPTTRFVQFYINGTRMLTGTFNTYTSGTVGLVYYRDTTASKLYVDIAKLSLTAPSAMTAGDGIYIDEAAIDMSIAENSETGGYTGVEWMAPEPR